MTSSVRDATPDDATTCAAIYEPYVLQTAITFEETPPGGGEMAARIAAAQQTHAWLVIEHGDEVAGYAYGGPYRGRPAYRFSCEVSVYVRLGLRRTGAGRALYDALLARLGDRGYRMALAAVALPNEASIGLHRSLGFTDIGTFRRVGWKFDGWHDVAWSQRELTSGSPDAALRG